MDRNMSFIHKKPRLDAKALKLGFTDTVPKPLSLEYLTYLIEKYMGNGADQESD
jgi:hypothetical protein